jgi:hypothetical protein
MPAIVPHPMRPGCGAARPLPYRAPRTAWRTTGQPPAEDGTDLLEQDARTLHRVVEVDGPLRERVHPREPGRTQPLLGEQAAAGHRDHRHAVPSGRGRHPCGRLAVEGLLVQ